MELKKWDTLEFVMLAEYEATFSWEIKLLEDYTDLSVQYLKSNR